MKRLHVHVGVADLDQSVRFYSTLFASEPTVKKNDYAKWMLEDPRVNFAISQRGAAAGINHLGLQTDSDAELETLHAQLARAGQHQPALADAEIQRPREIDAVGREVRRDAHGDEVGGEQEGEHGEQRRAHDQPDNRVSRLVAEHGRQHR